MQNDYIIDLIIYDQKISLEAKKSSDILNQFYKSEIGFKELCQMSPKLFEAYKSIEEINEDYFKFIEKENFIISKKSNLINIEMIISHGFKKIN